MKTKNSLNKGFSLMEMAVIVVVIGVLFMASASVLKGRNTSLKINETEKNMHEAYNTLIGFAKTKYQLPNNIAGDTKNFESFFSKTDGQGNEFAYYPAASIMNVGGGNNICNTNSTNLKLEIANPGATETLNNMAFVIAGSGPDLESKVTYQTPGGVPTVRIDRSDLSKFDDAYRYVTLTELKGYLQCQQPDHKLRIMTTSLGQINLNKASKDIIYSNRNNTRWCIESEELEGSTIYNNFHKNIDVRLLSENLTGTNNLGIKGKGQCTIAANFQTAYAIEIINDPTASPIIVGTYKFKVFATDTDYNSANPQQAYKTDSKIFNITITN